MARIRLTGGIVLAGTDKAWLVAEPGCEVDGARPGAGAAVVVGPQDAGPADVERACAEARGLVSAGGALVAAAGVDVGGGFRTACLDGGGEARRDAVLAALEQLGPNGMARIGPREAVLVALFGGRATKRVGAAALDALATGSHAAVRLAVAASDLFGPEQLEQILALEAPAGLEPMPQQVTATLAEQLRTLLARYSARRRLALVRSLWDDVVGWQGSAAARGRARRRSFSTARRDALRARIRRDDDRWWRAQAARSHVEPLHDALMLQWVPGPDVWRDALQRAFRQCVAATVLLRTALAAEDQPVVDAVLAFLDQLAYAATAADVDSLHGAAPPADLATERAWRLGAAVVGAADPASRFPAATPARLRAQLREACELASAVVLATVDLFNATGVVPAIPGVTAEWRRLAGYTTGRDPSNWTATLGPDASLAARLAEQGGDPRDAERVEDGLWLAELADTVACWFGHDLADVAVGGFTYADVDPEADEPAFGAPSSESIPLAVAGAAQLVALGARTGDRPASWQALVAELMRDAERLGLRDKFAVPADVVAWEKRQLPGTDLRVEVARTPQQLTEWGNYMGNCIASYAEDAGPRFALVGLREADARLVANVSVARKAGRWHVDQARARFNEALPTELEQAVNRWAHGLRAPDAGDRRPPAVLSVRRHIGRGRRRGGPGPARAALVDLSAELGQLIGDLDVRLPPACAAVGAELGWAGEPRGAYVAVARVRRAGVLADATGRALAAGLPLAALWEATGERPLAAAVAAHAGPGPDLRRLIDDAVPPSLRAVLDDPRVSYARAVDLAGRRVRVALFELLAAGDTRLDRAVVDRPHAGFVATAALALTASKHQGEERFASIPVAADGTVPGHPATSLSDPAGPWAAAREAAAELGVDGGVALAGRHLLVPTAWTEPGGWRALWARAHPAAREPALAPAG